jgi:hypothetical protein
MTRNDELLKAAQDAINALFSDKTVSQAVCRANLETLQSDIDTMLDSLEDDGT